MFHFFSVPLKNPEKTIWCNKMGKVVTKVWKPSVMFTQFIIIPNGINTKLNMVFLILSFVAFNSSLVFSSLVFSRMFSRLIADVESFTTSGEVSKIVKGSVCAKMR